MLDYHKAIESDHVFTDTKDHNYYRGWGEAYAIVSTL